uniref:Uncharacterized protein n=1 Tax=Brassica campestris TaxID=3711 RepID=M4EQ59_BRACM
MAMESIHTSGKFHFYRILSSFDDALRTNNREMDEINSKVDWDVSYRRRSTVRWTTHWSLQHQLWKCDVKQKQRCSIWNTHEVAGGTTEAVYRTKCGDPRARGEEYSSRQLHRNNVYPN